MPLQLDQIWAFDIKWDPATLGPKLKAAGDDFDYVYNEEAVKQVVYLAIKDSDYTQALINAHPVEVQKWLNLLKEEIEDLEWSVELGSISLSINYPTQRLEFFATIAGRNRQSIRIALDLAKGDDDE